MNKGVKLSGIFAGLVVLILIIVSTVSLGNIFNAEKKPQTSSSTAEPQSISSTDSTNNSSSDNDSTPDDLSAVSPIDLDLALVGPFKGIAGEMPESQLPSPSNGYEVDSRILDSYNALTDSTTQSKGSTDSTNNSSSDNNSTPDDLPAVSPTDWDLVLVGPFNEITEEVPESQLASLGNGYQVDSRIVDSYNALADAAEAAGFPLAMVSAFRSVADQQEVFDESVSRRIRQENVSEEEAIQQTSEEVTQPGYSEHHTGLAIDVVDTNWYNNYTAYATEVLDTAYGNEPSAQWLADNAAQYGFIIRYPDGGENITGIHYEPWHLRYVGVESATYMTQNDLTLEEYLELFS